MVHRTRVVAAVAVVGCLGMCWLPLSARKSEAPEPHIPALFQSYLNLGAKVWGPPAIDRAFKTIDFIVGLDITTVNQNVVRAFFR
mgnify:CR=1 FL=1